MSSQLWYEEKRAGPGGEFMAEVSAALGRIADMPTMYALRWEDVRTCRLRRFPYLIHFRILTDRIEVFAVLHGKRDSSAWRERI